MCPRYELPDDKLTVPSYRLSLTLKMVSSAGHAGFNVLGAFRNGDYGRESTRGMGVGRRAGKHAGKRACQGVAASVVGAHGVSWEGSSRPCPCREGAVFSSSSFQASGLDLEYILCVETQFPQYYAKMSCLFFAVLIALPKKLDSRNYRFISGSDFQSGLLWFCCFYCGCIICFEIIYYGEDSFSYLGPFVRLDILRFFLLVL